ncbi:hypothetical protein ACP8HZ_07245 [Francisella noatunensis]
MRLSFRWMYHDARRNNRKILPWLILTLIAGSFRPLLYLLFDNNKEIAQCP